MALLALVAHFPTCLSHLLCHIALAPIALVPNLATRWHHLHELKNWPQDGATCISCKFSHQLESLALPHCVGMPYWHYHLVLSWYLHQPESHQLSRQKICLFVIETRIHRSDQGHLGPIKTGFGFNLGHIRWVLAWTFSQEKGRRVSA